jgi:hypothetical protein
MTLADRAAAALAAAALFICPALAASFARPPYPENPPVAHTGGFGEPTCHACHFEAEPVADASALSVQGLPHDFVPGARYPLEVRLAVTGMRRAGFQLAIRFAEGEAAGEQAGTLAAAGDRATVTVSPADSRPGVAYAHHTRAGTSLVSPDSAVWRLEWVAPPHGGAVLVHVAANAANDDASELGDRIHLRSYRMVAR